MEIVNWQVGFDDLKIVGVAAVIGNFDGVHLGHKKLINFAHKIATKKNLKLAILSFDPHPREFFSKSNSMFLIQRKEDKINELKKLGIGYYLNIKFNEQLSQSSPESFVHNIISHSLNIKHVIVGKDFLFGKDRSGNIKLLEKVGKKIGLSVSTFEIIKHKDFKISSTAIRELIRDGKIELANKCLGRNFSITGEVIHGDKRGRSIDFPTANIKLENLIRPAYGVYAVYITGKGFNKKLGIANIGKRPTVNYRGELLEAHIFDEEIDLYGKEITVELIKYIRSEKKFNGIDDLKNQILIDESISRKFFEKILYRKH